MKHVATVNPGVVRMVAACNMSDVSAPRLLTKPFIAVTAATGAFFIYVGMLVPLLPRFIEDELGAGELGVGLSVSAFAIAAICARPMIGRLVERYGRRRMMIAGSLLAGLAGVSCAAVDGMPTLLGFRAVAGIGEAALFVGAATLVADLAPPDRRAEAASYFSVAVFTGLGVGPVIGEAILGEDRFGAAFVAAAGFTVLAAVMSLAVPHRVLPVVDSDHLPALPRRTGMERFIHPAALGPGLVLASGIASFAAFSAFVPEHARDVGLAGSAGLFATYSVVCLVLRIAGARVPERLGARHSVTIALRRPGDGADPAGVVRRGVGAVRRRRRDRHRHGVHVPVSDGPHGEPRRRPRASGGDQLVHDVLRDRHRVGRHPPRHRRRAAGKRASFAAAVLLCASGLWLLRTRVAPAPQVLTTVVPGERAQLSSESPVPAAIMGG